MAFGLQANYTDWAAATGQRMLVPAYVDRGVLHGQRGESQFYRREPLHFFQVDPHLSSQGLGGPRSRPTAIQKIWQRWESNLGPLGCSQEDWPLDHSGSLSLAGMFFLLL
jgi:hypothetical protein